MKGTIMKFNKPLASRLLLSTACVLLIPISSVSYAQDAGDNAQRSKKGDEIVVTARRKEETILDVPLPVTAFDETDIQEAGFRSFDDVFLLTPGVFNSTSGGRSDRITIRGFSQVSTTGGSNAGVFIDGVYISGPATALDLESLERIEIIKGPQSAQFGRGTLAGAVNYVTRRPSSEAEGKITATATTLDDYNLHGHWSGPIADNLSVMIGGGVRDKASEFFNQVTQKKDLGGKSSYGINGSVLFEPSNNLSVYWRASYSDISNDATGIYTQGPEFNNCNLTTTRQYYCGDIVIDYDNIRAINEDPSYVGGFGGTDRESFRTALIVDYDIDEKSSLQSITSWQNEDERWGSDATNRGVPSSQLLPDGPAVDISREWTDFSQELRFRRSMAENLELLLGGYYFKSERSEIATYLDEDRGIYTEENFALFGSLEFDVTDRLTLTGEVRYQEDDIELDSVTVPAGFNPVVSKFDAVLPRLTVDFQATEDMMLYGVYAKGNKPGSVNTRLLGDLDPTLIPIDEEHNEMFELGTKGRMMDGAIRYEVAGYVMKWENQQLTQNCLPPQCANSVTYTDNLGQTDIIGAEALLAFSPVPEFWDVTLTGSWTDSEIKSYEIVGSGSVLEEARGFGFPDSATGGVIVSGTPTPASPKWSFSATSEFGAPIANSSYEWFARADLSWVSEQFASVFGQASSGDRTNLNMRGGIENGDWRFEIFGNNLTDDETPLALVRTIRFDGSLRPPGPNPTQRAFSAIIPQGREFGISATRRF